MFNLNGIFAQVTQPISYAKAQPETGDTGLYRGQFRPDPLFRDIEQSLSSKNSDFDSNLNRSTQLTDPTSSAALQASRAFSLELETKEGDIVKIVVEEMSAIEQSYFFQQDSSGSQVAFSEKALNLSRFRFDIQGSISAEEKASINQVLDQVSVLASEFFQGNTNTALKLSESLSLDTDTLRQLKLSAEHTLAFSSSSATGYQNGRVNQNDMLAQLSNLSKSIDHLLDFKELIAVFDKLGEAFSKSAPGNPSLERDEKIA